ncbi:MAG: alpha/beta hydrolase [Anaerolineaceae bacterium]|nr:alpha/beta hydrolase [Anaerolineaceae bacterium]
MPETPRLDLLEDLGGQGPVLHLAHGNGFPPGTYRLFAQALAARHHVVALPARPLWPGSSPGDAPTWRTMAGDLRRGMEAMASNGIVAVGHSLGGVLTLWAALERPDLFRAVVLVDPVILPSHWLLALRLARALGLHSWVPLVRATVRRRRTWPDEQACFDHYRHKPLFARWSDEALWDYVRAATRQAGDGLVLRYPPEWEAHIFATVPAGIWRDVPRLRVPCLVLRGEHSRTFVPGALARVARLLPEARIATLRGAGHLLPMERPSETAAAILDFLTN